MHVENSRDLVKPREHAIAKATAQGVRSPFASVNGMALAFA